MILTVAFCVRNDSSSELSENKIAQNMVSMMKEKALKFQVWFLRGFCQFWLDPNMEWYQGKDIFVKNTGFLSFHRTVRYFIMIRQIDFLIGNWSTNRWFFGATEILNECEPHDQQALSPLVPAFLKMAKCQCHTHNERYLNGVAFMGTCFGEHQIGRVAARLILEMADEADTPTEFHSSVHGLKINLVEFRAFCRDKLDGSFFEKAKESTHVLFHSLTQSPRLLWERPVE
jgi:hypothetical protein